MQIDFRRAIILRIRFIFHAEFIKFNKISNTSKVLAMERLYTKGTLSYYSIINNKVTSHFDINLIKL